MQIINVITMLILSVACDASLHNSQTMTVAKSVQDEVIMYNVHKQYEFKQSKVKKYLKKLRQREEQEEMALKGQTVDIMDSIPKRPNQDTIPLTVHIVPNTHDDVGWGKTVEEYFSGAQGWNSHASVDLIITSVIIELAKDSRRKFTYVEMKFFHMWYKKQTWRKKQTVKKLIKNGQLEISMGGWSATDEACPNYEDMIVNMWMGHKFLWKEFRYRPKVGWMLDAFGHSEANAALFVDFGFEYFLFTRINDADRQQMSKDKMLHFMWTPFSKNANTKKRQILTHVTTDKYGPLPGMFYDWRMWQDDPVIDQRDYLDYNVDQHCKTVVEAAQNQSMDQRHKQNVLMLHGDDFWYQQAESNFRNLDILIEKCNKIQKQNIKLRYSTPLDYYKAIEKENVQWPVLDHDYFPYVMRQHEAWSGFYTSRPSSKKQIKDFSSIYHASTTFFSQIILQQQTNEAHAIEIVDTVDKMADALGVVQHHDGITGTEAEYVQEDYKYMMLKSARQGKKIYQKYVKEVLRKATGIQLRESDPNLLLCDEISQNDTVQACPINMKKNKPDAIVAVHFPRTQNQTSILRLLLPSANYRAQIWSSSQKTFVKAPSDIIKQQHYDRENQLFHDYLMFVHIGQQSAYMQSHGFVFLKLIKTHEDQSPKVEGAKTTEKGVKQTDANVFEAGAGGPSLTLLGQVRENYVLFQYENKQQDVSQKFGVNLKYYKEQQEKYPWLERQDLPYEDLTVEERQNKETSSGVYVFMPKWNEPLPVLYGKVDKDVLIQKGDLVQQMTLKFIDKEKGYYALVKVRFSKYFKELIEFQVELAPIPIDDDQGKSVTVNWKFFDNFDPKGEYWTDSNALEMQKRLISEQTRVGNLTFMNDQSNHNPNYWTVSNSYFPVDSAIAIKDKNSNKQVTIMTEKAQGGSADLTDQATIEIMQMRRLLFDDHLGIEEMVNETDADGFGYRINSIYYLQIFDTQKTESLQRSTQLQIQNRPQYFFSFDYYTNFSLIEEMGNDDNKQQQQMPHEVLQQFQISPLSIRLFPVKKNQILLMITNLADSFDQHNGKGSAKTKDLNLNLLAQSLYAQANPKHMLSSVHITEMDIQGVHAMTKSSGSFSKISLGNMEIRTFRVTFNGVKEEEPMRESLNDMAETSLLETDIQRPVVKSSQENNNNSVLILSFLGCVVSAMLGYLCNNIKHRKLAAQQRNADVQMASRSNAQHHGINRFEKVADTEEMAD